MHDAVAGRAATLDRRPCSDDPAMAAIALCAAILGALACALPAQSLQELRYDVGKRLRRFERAWAEAPADAEDARAKAAAAMQRAVASFFAMRMDRAAKELDTGYAALAGVDEPVALRLLSLRVAPSTCLAPLDGEIRLVIEPAYDADAWPEDLRPSIRVRDAGGPGAGTVHATRLPHDRRILGESLAEGDHLLTVLAAPGSAAVVPPDDAFVAVTEVRVSFVRDAKGRLDALARTARDAADPPLEAATLRGLARTLGGLARGDAVETDLPASRLLCEAEAVARAVESGEPFYGDDRPGQFWLRVPVGRRALPVRLLVPARTSADHEPRPLVLALHGAGGSENLFFDSYGDGLVARLADERGWYVCAPRAMPAGSAEALVGALAERWAIDRERVYCVGHSMGAVTAVAAAQRFPELFAKVAPLGGGGRVTDGEAIADVPFLVGVGERDFALAGAKALARVLERDGVHDVELRVYPGIEHMLVVQVALPDVFAFFAR